MVETSQPKHHFQFGICQNWDLGMNSEGLLWGMWASGWDSRKLTKAKNMVWKWWTPDFAQKDSYQEQEISMNLEVQSVPCSKTWCWRGNHKGSPRRPWHRLVPWAAMGKKVGWKILGDGHTIIFIVNKTIANRRIHNLYNGGITISIHKPYVYTPYIYILWLMYHVTWPWHLWLTPRNTIGFLAMEHLPDWRLLPVPNPR